MRALDLLIASSSAGGGSNFPATNATTSSGPYVDITYDAPTADLSGPGLSGSDAYAFPGTQPQDTASTAPVSGPAPSG